MATRWDLVALGAAFQSRYEVVEKIGEGGFGDVYKAHQLATGQMVAVKVLRIPEARPADEVERLTARFHREMRLCARLHHPNIVRLIDSGQGEGGGVYSVFEFIPGKSLASLLQEEQHLPPLEARHLMSQILDALASAHAEGVVHRDLKPANIMIRGGARRNAVVLDFGISSLTEKARDEEARITQTHEWVGSPSYAAPEQLRGEPPLARSDLYAWGLIFLECLTGARAIRGASTADIVFRQLSPEPVPIPDWIARGPLGPLLRRATEKRAHARDVTAEGLLRELEACDLGSVRGDEPGAPPSLVPPEPTVTIRGKKRADSPEEEVPPPELSAAPRQGEGERRQITAMCCTLRVVGHGSGAVDAEELELLLGAGRELGSTLALTHGGQVGGSLNDTLLLLFGYPSAHEDDARRAARAALALRTEVRQRGEVTMSRYRARLEVGIGVHTGMIVAREQGAARDRSPSFGGTTLHAATRLGALARPGEILVSGETQRLLRGHFAFDSRSATGDAGLGDAYVLREGATDAGAPELPLIGRQRELEALTERWNKVRGGGGQVVLITGEPGIGRSRLAWAFRQQLGTEPHCCLEGRCAQDARNSPLYPIVELLERLLDPGRELTSEAKVVRLKELLSSLGFDLAETLPLFAHLLSLPLPSGYTPLALSPQKQRELTHNALLSLLYEMGEQAPVVLIIEDLHWADPSTRELCAKLVGEVASARVYALFTSRPEFSPPWSPSSALTLQLGPLEGPDIARMASAVGGGLPLSTEAVERITSRTDGVPLFVEELVRMMLESEALVKRDGGLVLSGTLDSLGIPSSIRGLFTERLDRLGRARETAQVAAVIGREFSFDLLRAMLPIEEGTLREDLDALVNADLVHRKRRLRAPAYLFKHALIQDTAYDSIVKGRRRELHERVARTLQRDFPKMAEEQPESLAWHFERAGLHAEATDWLLQAGRRAMQRSAFIEASALLSHGVELAAQSSETEWAPRREVELRAALGGALWASRGFSAQEYEANGLRARQLCRILGDPPVTFSVVFALWLLYVVRGTRPELAEDCATELLALAEKSDSPAMRISARHARGTTCYYSQRYEQARTWLLRELEICAQKDHQEIVRTFSDDHGLYALCWLQHVELYSGRVGEALRYVERTRALVRELRDPLLSSVGALAMQVTYHLMGDTSRMEAENKIALRLTTEHGFEHWRMLARIAHGLVLARRGAFDRGLEEIDTGLRYFASNGQWTARPHWTAYKVEALLLAGRREEALAVIDETVQGAVGMLDQQSIPTLLQHKAHLLVGDGDREGALTLLRRALALAREQREYVSVLNVSLGLTRRLLEAGRHADAHTCLAEAVADIQDGRGWPAYEEAVRLLASLEAPRRLAR
ncbi:TOMM system kinase/cyclase fusion protein [Myxococcus sp. RHSTA-1-4]|uniref:TOMM system kinase/cyclase fusion protein n=1 Tax=Myxococcus sp. RHSTA-1-4 TaxID=2874601 RepID=UPI001CBD22EF|nr:TOMM system kinase/cyclase fusion protein [Myxococcus sp. RHSTA-1-4]MBZ4416830.1 TOMM system kinase/cyclase fusion protein [Myxococcus sp. RHSTA-1-4]